jgi:cobalt-zinc-cadmium resistance protein CzcA
MLQKKKELLIKTDSLYTIFVQKQQQRFKAGDAGILEKTAAETQQMQIASQLSQLSVEYKIVQLQFSRLLNTSNTFIPVGDKLKIEPQQNFGSVAVNVYPIVKLKAQQLNISLKEIAVGKTKKMPLLSMGYTNQSIAGIQNISGVDKKYTAYDRFSSALIGLNIPLFNKANKAHVAAGKLNYNIAAKEYEEVLKQHESLLQQLLLKKENAENQLLYFEKAALVQAKTITYNANLQLANGAINYLEWIMLINQSVSIQAEYINAVHGWNITIIELQAYFNN